MKKEIDALELNETWSLEDLPTDKHTIRYKCVFTIKYKDDRSMERYNV